MLIKGFRADENDEEGNNMDHDRSHDHIESSKFIFLYLDPLLHDGSLEIELHPGSDRCSHQANDHRHFGRVQVESRMDKLVEDDAPPRLHDDTGDNVRDVKDTSDQKDLLD